MDPTPSPQAADVGVDAGLLEVVVASSPADDPAAVRLSLIAAAARPESDDRDGLLEVETATRWSARARAAATDDDDPVDALLAQINGAEPVSVGDLETPTIGEGFTLVLRTRPERVDFMTGTGIRYLAAFTDDYAPLTDHNLFYCFEGLTSDGRYHVLMVMPLAASVLPDAPEPGTLETAVEFAGISDVYVATTSERLAHAAPRGFHPSLERLDAFTRSIAVR